jgi:hypothetical protein
MKGIYMPIWEYVKNFFETGVQRPFALKLLAQEKLDSSQNPLYKRDSEQ